MLLLGIVVAILKTRQVSAAPIWARSDAEDAPPSQVRESQAKMDP
jgi:hypothetical protein